MSLDFSVPVGTRKLRPRDLRRVADRAVDHEPAPAWQVVAMVELVIGLMGREGTTSAALIAEAAAVLVRAPAEVIARSLLSQMATEPTFQLNDFVSCVEREIVRAEPPKKQIEPHTEVPTNGYRSTVATDKSDLSTDIDTDATDMNGQQADTALTDADKTSDHTEPEPILHDAANVKPEPNAAPARQRGKREAG